MLKENTYQNITHRFD